MFFFSEVRKGQSVLYLKNRVETVMGGGSKMNVDKRSFLNVAKRSKVNILNLNCVADAAFGIRVVVLCVARTTFFASSMRFCVAGPAIVGSGYIFSCPRPASSSQVFRAKGSICGFRTSFCVAGTALGLRRRLLFMTGAAFWTSFISTRK